ncbi:leucine-rich repeat-containing protein 15-like [Diachasma alloeum]|uniref:leucine-rich repeat-containing protein 15-like n=1 Tax=Diachasma alloeum TaxID=454923 RepID=UPI000738409E|nr:leucine-rich repeat-containing protein 15-like [Diachasma alloeum]
MVKFLLISVLIFVSACSTTAIDPGNPFGSCNTTDKEDYVVCKMAANLNVLVRNTQDDLFNISRIDLTVYPADNSTTTPPIERFSMGALPKSARLGSVSVHHVELHRDFHLPRNERIPVVNLFDNNLTAFPTNITSRDDLFFILITNQKIRALSPNSFTAIMANLNTLSLEDIQLEEIEPNTFTQLSNLNHLRLRKNYLNVLHSDMFTGLKHLQLLDLTNNQIRAIEPGTFANISDTWWSLYLGGNQLKVIEPNTFTQVSKLHYLGLKSTQLTTIEPNTFMELSYLGVLDMEKNYLKVLSPHMFAGLDQLPELRLGYNQIHTIEKGTFMQLSGLEYLDLERNNLTVLHLDMFAGLDRLENLRLEDNPIDTINLGSSVSFSLLQKVFPDVDMLSVLSGFPKELNERKVTYVTGN